MAKSKNTMKHFEEKDGIKRKIYYHYTTLDALYKIISSKTFRLMSLSSTNDKTELSYSINNFWEDLQVVLKELDRTDDFLSDNINIYNKAYRRMNKSAYQSYALSLSDKCDNLAHWDRYADRCKGVCIALNVSALEIYRKRKQVFTLANTLFDIEGALYDNIQIRKILKRYLEDFYYLVDNRKVKVAKENMYRLYLSIYYELKKFVKSPCFIDESEVRIHYSEESIGAIRGLIDLIRKKDDSFIDSLSKQFNKIIEETRIEQRKYITTPKGIRSYHNLCLSEIWGNGLIPEIYLGPLCIQNINELNLFLKDNGLSGCKVTKSNVPIN